MRPVLRQAAAAAGRAADLLGFEGLNGRAVLERFPAALTQQGDRSHGAEPSAREPVPER